MCVNLIWFAKNGNDSFYLSIRKHTMYDHTLCWVLLFDITIWVIKKILQFLLTSIIIQNIFIKINSRSKRNQMKIAIAFVSAADSFSWIKYLYLCVETRMTEFNILQRIEQINYRYYKKMESFKMIDKRTKIHFQWVSSNSILNSFAGFSV